MDKESILKKIFEDLNAKKRVWTDPWGMGKQWERDQEKRDAALAALRYCELTPEIIEQAKKDIYATIIVSSDPWGMGNHREPDKDKREVAQAILENVWYQKNISKEEISK